MRYISKVGVVISYTQWYVSATTQDYIYVIRSCTYMSNVGVLKFRSCVRMCFIIFQGDHFLMQQELTLETTRNSRLKCWQCVITNSGNQKEAGQRKEENIWLLRTKAPCQLVKNYVDCSEICCCVINYLVLLVSLSSSTSSSTSRGSGVASSIISKMRKKGSLRIRSSTESQSPVSTSCL